MRPLIYVLTLLVTTSSLSAHAIPLQNYKTQLQAIEREFGLKIGVYAHDTNTNAVIAHHADERFPFQSTCKFLGAAALLASNQEIQDKKVRIRPSDLIFWHPISGQYVNQSVALKTLAEGAVSYSDNTAINMIFRELGGLKAMNQFARSIGNASFIIKHYEAQLNSNPANLADTSTPKDMAFSVQKILLGTVLQDANKALLLGWMRNNTTGYNRIRAGVPLGWSVAEKTGSGSYGIVNDIGIAWSPSCKPVVLSIFTQAKTADAKPRDEVVAAVTRVIFESFSPLHPCYQAAISNP